VVGWGLGQNPDGSVAGNHPNQNQQSTKGKTMICSKCNRSFDSLMVEELCADCYQQSEARRLGIIDLARDYHQREGWVEIDDDASLSEGNDNGCYVAAWVWIGFSGTEHDKEKKGNDERHESTEAAS
jgi:hypothetical protein